MPRTAAGSAADHGAGRADRPGGGSPAADAAPADLSRTDPAEAPGDASAAEAPAGGGAAPGGWRARARRWPARLPGLARQHWLATVLLAAGVALRLLAQFSYGPALIYIDSVKYLYGAWPASDPLGYDVPLKLILAVGNLSAVEAVQHVLMLATAVTLYLLLLRRGVPRWLAALAMGPILLDAYQLQMESTIMPDVWFEAIIVAGVAILLWRPRITARTCLLAGAVLGLAATVRQVGEILIAPALLFVLAGALLARQGGWRQALRKSVALAAAFAVPILAYSSGSYFVTGHFWLSRNGSEATYGRMAGLADCATLKLPSYARPLCPTPREQAKGPDDLDHQVTSPLRTYEPPAGVTVSRGAIIANFNHAVLVQQPLRVVSKISSDAAKLFSVTRHTDPGDTPISRWQFQGSYPIYLPTVFLNPQGTITFALKLGPADGATIYRKLDVAYGGNSSVWKPGASFLRRYQLYGGYTPGPLLLLCLLAGLAGALTVFRRRASEAQRQLALGATLFVATAVAVLLMSDLFEFSWRYQLPALVTLPPAGALGIAVILRYARRRKSDHLAAAARPDRRVAARTG
ncbi:MAG TPA: hypothetical protein VK586_00640 [Streptosporangiaceae bacterium]|nr:hypothetical protein [Streptosporangiaceae bacterium]